MNIFLRSQENSQHQLKVLSPRSPHLPSHLIRSHAQLWDNYCGHGVGSIDWLKPIPNWTTRLGNTVLFRGESGVGCWGGSQSICYSLQVWPKSEFTSQKYVSYYLSLSCQHLLFVEAQTGWGTGSFWSSTPSLLRCHHFSAKMQAKGLERGFGMGLRLGVGGAVFKQTNWSRILRCQPFLFFLNPQASETFHG